MIEIEAPEPGKIVAFYSFKGGTGRSMALANVGCILAQDPDGHRPILLIDWDLEAPGLHRYFRKHLFGAFRGNEELQDASPGLIDLFIELRNSIGDRDDAVQEFEAAKKLMESFSLDEYIIKTDIPGLHIIKAGRFDDQYAQKVGTFEWLKLYSQSPFLLRVFADRLAREYRYVLVDSRTGLTDTSGICAMLLPEILVVVFTPNIQSVSGVINLVRDAGRYRSRSDDLRPLIVYPLPSRIEASEPTLRKLWRSGDGKDSLTGFQPAFEAVFKQIYGLNECDLTAYFDDVQIQHVPKYAYGEEIAALVEEARDRFSLTRSFQRFTQKLASAQAPWLVQPFREEAAQIEDVSKAYEQIRDIANASYLQKIEPSVARLKSRQRTVRKLEFAGGICAVFASTLAAVLSGHSYLVEGLSILAATIVAAGLFFTNRFGGLAAIAQAAVEIDRELDAFRSKRAPYDRDDALEKFRDRIETLLEQANETGPTKAASRVFISYRREDSLYAARLRDALSNAVGADQVFLDIDNIPLGADLHSYIRSAVDAADILIVLIGPSWIKSERLLEPNDFVRLELAFALARNKRIIPVLVGGMAMPRQSELPEEVQSIAFRNSISLSQSRWDVDILKLIQDVNRSSPLS